MPGPIYPHTVKVRTRTAFVGGGRAIKGAAYTNPVVARCFLEPLTPGDTAENYGLELTRPYRLIWPLQDETVFPVLALIEGLGGWFEVRTAARPYAFGNASDHCEAVVERLETAPVLRVED